MPKAKEKRKRINLKTGKPVGKTQRSKVIKPRGRKMEQQIKQNEVVTSNPISAKVQSRTENLLNQLMYELTAGHKYQSLIGKIGMIIDKRAHGLFESGEPGVGKTKTTIDKLESEGLKEGKDFFIIKGHSTPMSLFESLYYHKEDLIIFDDCDGILRNQIALNILKAALDDKPFKKISYRTQRKKSELPQEFQFSGRVIFITNHTFRNDDLHVAAIKDRCLYSEFNLSPSQKLEFIEKIMIPSDYKDTTFEDRNNVFKLLKETVTANGAKFSFRTFNQLLDFYKHDAKNFDVHLVEILAGDTEATLILSLFKKFKDSALVRDEFIKITARSRRHYYYVKKELDGIIDMILQENKD